MVGTETEPNARPQRRSREAVRLAIAIVLLLTGAATSALTGGSYAGDQPGRAERSATHSRFLHGDVGFPGIRAAPLRVSVTELRRRDHAFRLLAGLEPGDGDPPAAAAHGWGDAVVQTLWTVNDGPARQAYQASVDLHSIIRRARLDSFSWREAEDSVLEYRDRLETTPSIVPANGYISSGFTRARFHPILALRRPHRGLDIVAPYGSPIMAAARGRVSFVGYAGEYGLTIEIDHGRGLMTRYAHASRALVQAGQRVVRGDTIARVGRSGLADGPHVHYEVLVNGEPRNPRHYIFDPNIVPD